MVCKLGRIAAFITGVASMLGTGAAGAQGAYPDKPIRMLVAFPAGGPTDVNARLFAQYMAEKLGQPVIVDNRPGAGGNVASTMVASAPKDGYTLLYNTSSFLLGALAYKSATHTPLKDFVPIVRTVGVPLVVAMYPKVPAKSMQEFVALAKAKPGKMNYASSGAGTIDHLAFAMLESRLGIDLTHVPYKGTAPALADLVGGQTETFMTTLNTVLPFVQSKQLTALAVGSKARSPLLPGVPTVAEATGIPNIELTAWNGIVAPVGTSAEVVSRLNAVVNDALKDAVFLKKLEASGAEPYGGTPEAYEKFLATEQVSLAASLKEAGIEKQ
ncbi:Bug family tripartite tricarboxylate transporter substrate binding protein [Variovorax sp. N23]|uniref:Bug family tripartite tricarboxylate transporter substrate binding protein n=1 Tax=Variovorax sp. N23 TaxID=2980555 RepID=UPI0021C99722|nr:tripartite tricarboxylate transporter substrate binding protein [Variovorax sp. N23]MCU4122370.1 tripartite tricarboxylate transporter substrate binding protein [Variovorax sp. N23]